MVLWLEYKWPKATQLRRALVDTTLNRKIACQKVVLIAIQIIIVDFI